MKVLFEPWNLGDAIIAASIARQDPDRILLACNSRWHEVLQRATEGSLKMLPLDLPYVWRHNKKFFSLGDAASLKDQFSPVQREQMEIISIRGDLRDWIAAQRIFSGATFSFTGWRPFLARKLTTFDRPFASGEQPVRNRYRAWADAAGISYDQLENRYVHNENNSSAPIVIHIGAQWRSKQYPHVAELVEVIHGFGMRTEILAGPHDPLPERITEISVKRPGWHGLIAYFRQARCVICNDSGPMHLAAFLGSKTLALSRCSNIAEWLPPGGTSISSPFAPLGYHPIKQYWSDHILSDWPQPDAVIRHITI